MKAPHGSKFKFQNRFVLCFQALKYVTYVGHISVGIERSTLSINTNLKFLELNQAPVVNSYIFLDCRFKGVTGIVNKGSVPINIFTSCEVLGIERPSKQDISGKYN